MKEVLVDKAKLIRNITENRANHIAAYEDAKTGYEAKFKGRLADAFEKSKKGDVASVRGLLYKIYSMPIPESHEKAYDTALAMLNDSVDEQVTIDRGDYDRYVLDDWEWKDRFVGTNSAYSSI